MDKDSSEAIEMRKLLFAVRSVMKLTPSLISDSEVAKLFVTLDENGNGEFFFFLQHSPNILRESCRAAALRAPVADDDGAVAAARLSRTTPADSGLASPAKSAPPPVVPKFMPLS